MDSYTYALDDEAQYSIPGTTRLAINNNNSSSNSNREPAATAAHTTAAIVCANGTRNLSTVRAKRTRKQWVDPLIDTLNLSLEPNCAICNHSMDSWDLYFDHITFDQTHIENAARALVTAASAANSRTKPTSRTNGSYPSSSPVLYAKDDSDSRLVGQSSSPIM
ncbi:hypothetical protein GGF38_001281 [Coemansia sp. RSA 25]|nr:hypothetical protein GGF38_001281 [Coemansia sp. RSA 25]